MTLIELREMCAKICDTHRDKSATLVGATKAMWCAEDIRAIQLPEQEPVAAAWDLFKQSLYIGMRFTCGRYLMSNAHGRWDGAEKAQRHMELCQYIIASVFGCDVDVARREHENEYQAVHTATQVLTDNLDAEIGFPIDSKPDYDDLEPKFFNRFFDLAMTALNMPSTPSVAALENKLSNANFALNEWLEKTEWVQKTAQPKELGKHRADVINERIAELEKQVAELKESLRFTVQMFGFFKSIYCIEVHSAEANERFELARERAK